MGQHHFKMGAPFWNSKMVQHHFKMGQIQKWGTTAILNNKHKDNKDNDKIINATTNRFH